MNVGTPEQRRYDLNVQGIVNGQPLNGLTVRVGGVVLGAAAPTGCA